MGLTLVHSVPEDKKNTTKDKKKEGIDHAATKADHIKASNDRIISMHFRRNMYTDSASKVPTKGSTPRASTSPTNIRYGTGFPASKLLQPRLAIVPQPPPPPPAGPECHNNCDIPADDTGEFTE